MSGPLFQVYKYRKTKTGYPFTFAAHAQSSEVRRTGLVPVESSAKLVSLELYVNPKACHAHIQSAMLRYHVSAVHLGIHRVKELDKADRALRVADSATNSKKFRI